MRTYTSRGPAAHGSRRVLSSSCFTSRSSVTLRACPCTRTLQPSWSTSSRWSAWKLTRPSAYTASSVSGAVRKTIVFLATAKLTGSIMIPSAAANPTRPTPPGSSRLKHSAGPSVRKARWPEDPAAVDCSSVWASCASRLLADPVAVFIVVHLRHSRGCSISSALSRGGGGAVVRGPAGPGHSTPVLQRWHQPRHDTLVPEDHMAQDASSRQLIVAGARLGPVPLAPEIRLHQASDPISLWQHTEAVSGRTGLDPP